MGGLYHTNPVYVEADRGLGWTYLYLKKQDQAQKAFNKVLKIYPNDASALEGLAKINDKN